MSICVLFAFGQEHKAHWWQEHADWGGYVKYMNTINFHNTDDLLTDNLWHNRWNVSMYFNDFMSFSGSLRNRIFYGDMLKMPFFDAGSLDKDPGLVDLTFLPVHRSNLLMQATIDRLYMTFNKGKWSVNLGRQRINWGINTVWNPNDLFNSSNFLDIDYEEKPGADALQISYETGDMSRLEIVYKPGKDFIKNQEVLALRYQFNFKEYDIQLIAAKYREDLHLGWGWAGNIYNWSFKGEASYFFGKTRQENVFIASVGLDYSFKNGINWTLSGWYDSHYQQTSPDFFALYNMPLDAKHLFPSRYAVFNGFSGDFGPAWQWQCTGIFAIQNHLTILMPQLSYSIDDAWRLAIFGQSFFADLQQIKQRNMLYFRLGWFF